MSSLNKRIHLPPDERREQIVRGALQIFAEKGFDATTNKEIARVAGISSTGLIYHYFKDKVSLLRAVIEMKIGERPRIEQAEGLMQMPLEDGLRLVARQFLQDIHSPDTVAFVRIIMGEAMRRPEFAKILSEVMVSRMFRLVTAFFQHHQEQGNLRPGDPALLTLRFVGSLTSVLMMREVLQIPEIRALDFETIEEGLVMDFLRGVLPEPSPNLSRDTPSEEIP
jgi:AcrR family transcriptional regulator